VAVAHAGATGEQQAAASIDEMRKGIRVLDALDTVGDDDVLVFDDSDYEFLQTKVERMLRQWSTVGSSSSTTTWLRDGRPCATPQLVDEVA
jgi:hypothetical protein